MEIIDHLRAELAVLRQAPVSALILFAIGASVAWWLASTVYSQHIEFLRDKSNFVTQSPTENQNAPPVLPNASFAKPSELTSKVIINRTFRITDVLTATESMIRDRTFQNCNIVGPALVTFYGKTTMQRNEFFALGGKDSLFWKVEPNAFLVGVIGVENSTFLGCRFYGIGLVGTPAEIELFKGGITAAGDSH